MAKSPPPRLTLLKSFLKPNAEKVFVTIFNEHEGDWRKIAIGIGDDPLLKDKATDLSFISQMADFSFKTQVSLK